MTTKRAFASPWITKFKKIQPVLWIFLTHSKIVSQKVRAKENCGWLITALSLLLRGKVMRNFNVSIYYYYFNYFQGDACECAKEDGYAFHHVLAEVFQVCTVLKLSGWHNMSRPLRQKNFINWAKNETGNIKVTKIARTIQRNTGVMTMEQRNTRIVLPPYLKYSLCFFGFS